MNKFKLYLLALLVLVYLLQKRMRHMVLQLMQEQHSIDMMKSRLKLNATDLYNPNGYRKDAVGIFGRGLYQWNYLIGRFDLTNHHCGYSSIQQHKLGWHDYLTDGFGPLPGKKLPHRGWLYIHWTNWRCTDIVNAKLHQRKLLKRIFLGNSWLHSLKVVWQKWFERKKGIIPQALPFLRR